MAFLAWRWFRPPIAWLLTAAAIGVAFASVYTQNHYAVDSIAGVVWALGLQVFVAPVLLRGLRSCESRSPRVPLVRSMARQQVPPNFGDTPVSWRLHSCFAMMQREKRGKAFIRKLLYWWHGCCIIYVRDKQECERCEEQGFDELVN